MRAHAGTLIPLTAALLLTTGAARADEVRFQDGTSLIGQLVTVIVQDTGGQVHVVPRDNMLLATVSAQPMAIQPPASGGWGARGQQAAPVPAHLPPASGRRQFTMHLNYEAPVAGPDIAVFGDPGEVGEVYIYKPIQAKNRAAWVRVGTVRRVENEVLSHFSAEEECGLLRSLVRGFGGRVYRLPHSGTKHLAL